MNHEEVKHWVFGNPSVEEAYDGLLSVVYCSQCWGTERVPVAAEKELTGQLCPRCEVEGVNSPLKFSHLEDGSVEL